MNLCLRVSLSVYICLLSRVFGLTIYILASFVLSLSLSLSLSLHRVPQDAELFKVQKELQTRQQSLDELQQQQKEQQGIIAAAREDQERIALLLEAREAEAIQTARRITTQKRQAMERLARVAGEVSRLTPPFTL